MSNKNLRIVFMGTPEFAVHCLRNLVENQYNIAGVITMPDKPAGRGQKLYFSEVKQYATEVGLPVLQPTNLKSPDFITELKALKADLQIVVAFRMLPEIVWAMPPLGTFNLHASLLPNYRGAAPINYAIINGETETGVTTFFLQHEIDTGNIIFQQKIAITNTDTAGILHDKLMTVGAELVAKTVDAVAENSIKPISQAELINNETIIKDAPKILKADCRIIWKRNGEEIYNLIRGLSPYPTAFTEMKAEDDEAVYVKIFAAQFEKATHNHETGSLFSDNKTYIKIAVCNGFIYLENIQLANKKRLDVRNVLMGFKASNYQRVE